MPALLSNATILTQRRALLIALLISLLLHAAAYLLSPRWVDDFVPARPGRYDATLQALAPQVAASAAASATTSAPNLKAVQRAKPIAKSPPPAASDASVVAPEGAIALAAADVEAVAAANSTTTTTAPDRADVIAEDVAATPSVANNQAVGSTAVAPLPTQLPAPLPAVEAPANDAAATVAPTLATSKRAVPAFAERMVIEYKLTSSITDGIANFRWSRMGDQYEIESTTQATGFLVAAFAGTIHQRSAGHITEQGLRPSLFSIRRGEGEAETAEFAHDTRALILTRKRESRTMPLARELQDMQSFLFQLAYEAPRLPDSAEKLDVLVTNARKVYRHQFRKMGAENIDTRFGSVETVRWLSESTNPEDTYEVWLAPQYQSLPVKLKMYLGKFPVEQVATRISVSSR